MSTGVQENTMRTITIQITDVESGSVDRIHTFRLSDSEAFQVSVVEETTDAGLTLHDWGYSPEDSLMYRVRNVIPDYAISRWGGDEKVLATFATADAEQPMTVKEND
jgi:hypothetical protein